MTLLQDLPTDMIYCILEFADSIDRIKFMSICRMFYSTVLELPLSLDLIHRNRIGQRRLKILVENCESHLTKLTRLDLSENNLAKEGVECLCKCEGFPNLKILILQNNNIGSAGASFIGTCSKLRNLEELNLNSNLIGDVGLRLLSLNVHFEQSLKSLTVSANSISDTGIKFIASMVNLTKLNASNNNIRNSGIGVIANNLQNLTELNLDSNRLENVIDLCKLTKLTHLDLGNCILKDSGLKEFAENSQMVNLRVLNLRTNEIKNLEPLASCKTLSSLEKLCLANNAIGENLEPFLEKCKHFNPFPSLEFLDLSLSLITYEGATLLASSPILDKLKGFNLYGNNIGNAEKLPRLQNISTSVLFTSL